MRCLHVVHCLFVNAVMCQRMVRAGNCRYGQLCDFAHDPFELRRNLNQYWYHGSYCDKKDHDDKKCEYAHNEMEMIYHPAIYKTKLCPKFASQEGCPKNLVFSIFALTETYGIVFSIVP
jgi:hypothetical protein